MGLVSMSIRKPRIKPGLQFCLQSAIPVGRQTWKNRLLH